MWKTKIHVILIKKDIHVLSVTCCPEWLVAVVTWPVYFSKASQHITIHCPWPHNLLPPGKGSPSTGRLAVPPCFTTLASQQHYSVSNVQHWGSLHYRYQVCTTRRPATSRVMAAGVTSLSRVGICRARCYFPSRPCHTKDWPQGCWASGFYEEELEVSGACWRWQHQTSDGGMGASSSCSIAILLK